MIALCNPVIACPTNELIYATLTPLTMSFEKRDGTGEDTANTANKRIAVSYWDGTGVRWWNATDWTSTTEQLLTMTQVTGSQYRYNFTPNATVSGQFLMIRYDETDNVDVTKSCVVYVQPSTVLYATTKDRALDVSATGEAGIDWANISNPASSVSLSGTTVGEVSGLKWATFNIVDLTNEGGDQNPTTTSSDTDLTWAYDFTNTSPQPIMYFPTTNEDPAQNAACPVQGFRTGITAYNTTTKVITYNTLPIAPDYRCVLRIY